MIRVLPTTAIPNDTSGQRINKDLFVPRMIPHLMFITSRHSRALLNITNVALSKNGIPCISVQNMKKHFNNWSSCLKLSYLISGLASKQLADIIWTLLGKVRTRATYCSEESMWQTVCRGGPCRHLGWIPWLSQTSFAEEFRAWPSIYLLGRLWHYWHSIRSRTHETPYHTKCSRT